MSRVSSTDSGLWNPDSIPYRDMDRAPESLIARVLPPAVVAVVLAVALLPAMLAAVGRGDDAAGLGGDFPSFYAAGRIMVDGEADDLYDPGVQRVRQQDFNDEGEFLYFAYPPFVATAYAALAWLPYGVALTVQILLAVGSLTLAARLGVPRSIADMSRRRHVIVAVALALASYPILRAVLGGQNTAFTIAVIIAAWWLLDRGAPFASGVAAGVLLYKPQFAVVLLLVLVAFRAWRAIAGFGVTAVALYAVGALTHGLGWVRPWLDQVAAFADANEEVNGHLMVNITGWVDAAIPAAAPMLPVVLVLFVGAVVVVVAARVGPRWGILGVVTGGVVLLAPSALYYDAGVALFGFGIFAALLLRNAWWFAAAIAASWSQVLAADLGWSPLFVVLLAALAAQLLSSVWPANVSHPTGTLAALAEPDGGESTWRVTGSS